MKLFKNNEFRWAEPVGLPECPYLIRWVLVVYGYAIRIHHWLGSDDQRYPHDHGWWYISFLFRGGYWERTYNGTTQISLRLRTAPSIRFYRASHCHKVEIQKGKTAWTLLLTGRMSRNWGFWIPGREKLLRPLKYFSRYGHHPCE